MSENFFDFMIWLSFTSTSLLISLWIEYRKLKRELCKKIDRYEEKIDEYKLQIATLKEIHNKKYEMLFDDYISLYKKLDKNEKA